MADTAQEPPPDLLYPFYLDTDMSMAFAAALSGGVALESELTARTEANSRAAKTLRGSLGLFGGAGIGGSAERGTAEGHSAEATLVRKHTMHSIFMALNEDLRASGRLRVEQPMSKLAVGDLVSMKLKPAIAPLRRVVEQVLRLLDVMAPVIGLDAAEQSASGSRQERRERARQAARAAADASSDGEDLQALAGLRALFVALRDDLEHSGMVDVVVRAEDGPGVILTLDKRFADATALELLHTSSFTVVGKVTQMWATEDDMVLLYRRSALSLVPALSGQVMVGVLGFLFSIAKSVGSVDVEQQLAEIVGGHSNVSDESQGNAAATVGQDGPNSSQAANGHPEVPDDNLRVGNDVDALNPVLTGPAVQVLPLALCV